MELTLTTTQQVVTLTDTHVALAQAHQTTMLDANELLHIAAALVLYPWEKGSFVVEIGAYLGTTTVFMAKILETLNSPATILSIDPFERFRPDALNPQGNYSSYLHAIRTQRVDQRCVALPAFSADVAGLIADDIGVLVVDGDHHYPAVSKDLALYCPKVREGGYIFVDDYGPAYPDVVRAIDEYFTEGTDFTVQAKDYFILAQRRPRKKAKKTSKKR
jgi:predicted O-methyltransferase YrrM